VGLIPEGGQIDTTSLEPEEDTWPAGTRLAELSDVRVRNLRGIGRAAAAAILGVGIFVAGPAAAQGQVARAPVVPVERPRFNKLANAAFESAAMTESFGLPQWFTVAGATNTTPIEVATTIPHGLDTGESVAIKGVAGNTGANGWWTITVRTPTTFSLDGSAGNASYAGGGSIFPAVGQPPPPGPSNDAGELGWTPWFSGPAEFPPTEFFLSDGARGTGEISTFPRLPTVPEPTLVNSFASQEIAGELFRPGERLCLSVEAKVTEPAADRQKLTMIVTAVLGVVRVYRASFPGSQLSDQYQRFALCFTIEPNAVIEEGVLRVEFVDEISRGAAARTMLWTRPMLSEGFDPVPWTPTVEPTPRRHAFY
jgi:hypothetical protein